jgi:tetratricopeptide (TPR) repeat protein
MYESLTEALDRYTFELESAEQMAAYYEENVRQFDRAIEKYTKLIEITSDKAELYYCRGKFCHWTNKNAEAIEDFTKAIELEPLNTEYYRWRGAVCYFFGKYEESVSDQTKLTELNPNDAGHYFWRGMAYSQWGKSEKALQDVTTAIGIKPDASMYCYRAGLYTTGKQYDKAIADYNKALDLDPGHENSRESLDKLMEELDKQ